MLQSAVKLIQCQQKTHLMLWHSYSCSDHNTCTYTWLCFWILDRIAGYSKVPTDLSNLSDSDWDQRARAKGSPPILPKGARDAAIEKLLADTRRNTMFGGGMQNKPAGGAKQLLGNAMRTFTTLELSKLIFRTLCCERNIDLCLHEMLKRCLQWSNEVHVHMSIIDRWLGDSYSVSLIKHIAWISCVLCRCTCVFHVLN